VIVGKVGDAVPGIHVVRAAGGLANLLRLTNNGGVQFLLERTDGNDWQFSNFGPTFQISVPGVPASIFSVKDYGDVFVTGNVHAQGYLGPSSRVLKENFTAVDQRDILARLVQMPINMWTYVSDEAELQHLGPTVEDFNASFGFGTLDKEIFLGDVNGVALAAVQGLWAELQARDARITDLERQIADLRQLIGK
jgi:hypothetical protein